MLFDLAFEMKCKYVNVYDNKLCIMVKFIVVISHQIVKAHHNWKSYNIDITPNLSWLDEIHEVKYTYPN